MCHRQLQIMNLSKDVYSVFRSSPQNLDYSSAFWYVLHHVLGSSTFGSCLGVRLFLLHSVQLTYRCLHLQNSPFQFGPRQSVASSPLLFPHLWFMPLLAILQNGQGSWKVLWRFYYSAHYPRSFGFSIFSMIFSITLICRCCGSVSLCVECVVQFFGPPDEALVSMPRVSILEKAPTAQPITFPYSRHVRCHLACFLQECRSQLNQRVCSDTKINYCHTTASRLTNNGCDTHQAWRTPRPTNGVHIFDNGRQHVTNSKADTVRGSSRMGKRQKHFHPDICFG